MKKPSVLTSSNKGQRAHLLPGPSGAEPWEVWMLGAQNSARLVQTCATPLQNRLRKGTTLALPISQVHCLPLWLNATDARLFAAMIALQLELHGLQPRGNEAPVFDWTVVAQEGTRTLVVVGVLPAALAPELHAEAYDNFDLSARYLPFPESSLTLWPEQDRLALALTRGPSLVYYQALVDGQITPRLLQDLTCVRATLAMQDILAPLKRVTLWTKVSAEESTALRDALRLPVEHAERPSPLAPAQMWKLMPATVSEATRTRANRRGQKRALLAAALLYFLIVAGLLSRFFITSYQVDQLRKWQSAHAPALAAVQQGRAAWEQLAPVVDTDNYPLELLLHASEAIPADQLHLTLFETSAGHLLIKGEAKNVAGAFEYLAKLKNDPRFSSYPLTMSNPRPLPNDLAQFQIEGARATAN